ncbi:MAG: ABC transporter permease, partial [Gaiellales bacterium]
MSWALDNLDVITEALIQHLWLTIPPILLTLALTIPIAWVLQHFQRLATPVVALSALLYTIPSLPLFLMIPVVLGTGLRSPLNLVIALTLYGLALLVPITVPA